MNTAVKSAPLTLKASMTAGAACKRIVANCLDQLEANAAGVTSCDTESVHQMRVGLRRLRSALAIFKEHHTLAPALARELDWLGGVLGTARDWDVLAHATLPAMAQAEAARPHVAQIFPAALRASETYRQDAATALGSRRYLRLAKQLARWCAQQDKKHKAAVSKFARKTLARSRARLQKRGAMLDGTSAEAIHRVRIAAKKMRYASEFFQSLYPGRKLRRTLKHLAALQDDFGRLNDLNVAVRLLASLGSSAAFCCGYLACAAERERQAVPRRWRTFAQHFTP